jgi:membrane glycosyltransferase
VTGILISLQARFVPPDYFPSGPSLFPQWPVQDPVRSMWVFVGTMAVLLIPKLLGFTALLMDKTARRSCGAAALTFAGLLVETVVAGLIAPVTMLVQSIAFMSILVGRTAAGCRSAARMGASGFANSAAVMQAPRSLAWRLGVASYLVAPSLLLWMLRVVLGLALAVPLTAATAERRLGQTLRRIGLLRTPEEILHPRF